MYSSLATGASKERVDLNEKFDVIVFADEDAEIIKEGYGHAYTRYPFKYMEEFRAHEREARRRAKGLWGRK